MLDRHLALLDDRGDKLGVLDSLPDRRPARAARPFPPTMPVDDGLLLVEFRLPHRPVHRRQAFHTGVDLIAPPGTPVLAAAGGMVSTVAFMAEYGNIVDVDHDNGLTSRYAHLSKSLVRVGDVVMKGQNIASSAPPAA